MSVQFQIKTSQEVKDSGECMRGLNILGHAQLIELDLGSTCGGHGKCGKDRVQLLPADQAKVNPPTEIELIHLTPLEIAEGVRLACQCFPHRDGLSITCLK